MNVAYTGLSTEIEEEQVIISIITQADTEGRIPWAQVSSERQVHGESLQLKS